MESVKLSKLYDAFYYTHYEGGEYLPGTAWEGMFAGLAEQIIARFLPRTTLDAGCAIGFLVAALRDRGVEAFGVDLSEFAIQQVRHDVKPFCWVGSLTDPLPQKYDLITSFEVLEHLPPEECEKAIKNLCTHTDDILFSSTPFHYKDATHLNVRPPDYWAELFAYQGFFRDADFDASFVSPWAVRYRRTREVPARIVAAYERRLWQLEKENQGQREINLEIQREIAAGSEELIRLKKILDQTDHSSRPLSERLSAQLAEKNRMIDSLRLELAGVTNSRGWRYLQKLWRIRRAIIPPNSLRAMALKSGIAYLKGERRHGVLTLKRNKAHQTMIAEAIVPPTALESHQATVEIIVCVHNAFDDVKRCLESVLRYTDLPYFLIIVDDGSQPETRDYLANFAGTQGARLIRNEQAKGYTFAANQGLRLSQGDYALLLNSDTVVTPRWLDRMVACGESSPRIGLIGPLSNTASWQSIPEIESPDGDWAENRPPDWLTISDLGNLTAQSSARLYPRLSFLNGFCLMIKRKVLNEIGYFDEEVFGPGFGEENDYCLRARKAGYELAVADDAYVYHHQSRSYSHERRKLLCEQADRSLIRKHGEALVQSGVEQCRCDRTLEGIRARARAMLRRERAIQEAKSRWEGQRILFIVPIAAPGGGGNVIFQEAASMAKMGVDATILNYPQNAASFEQSYPDLPIPVIYRHPEDDLTALVESFDAVVATANYSVEWLRSISQTNPDVIKGYYIQDFEPYFYGRETENYRTAWNSYTLLPDLTRFTKTEWTRSELKKQIGVECKVVGPSVNLDLFRPRPRKSSEESSRPLRIAAMIRPSSPYRGGELTMKVFQTIHRRFGRRVSLELFGSRTDDPAFQVLPRRFGWTNYGVLTRPQLAWLLNEVDLFVDFSTYQAMGLTALEAMACGAAVIAPLSGGADSFIQTGQNGLLVDTSSQKVCEDALANLIEDDQLRTLLQRRAIFDACQYPPEIAALEIVKALFDQEK